MSINNNTDNVPIVNSTIVNNSNSNIVNSNNDSTHVNNSTNNNVNRYTRQFWCNIMYITFMALFSILFICTGAILIHRHKVSITFPILMIISGTVALIFYVFQFRSDTLSTKYICGSDDDIAINVMLLTAEV